MATLWGPSNPRSTGSGESNTGYAIPPWSQVHSQSPGEIRSDTASGFGVPNPPGSPQYIVRATGARDARGRLICNLGESGQAPTMGQGTEIYYSAHMRWANGWKQNQDSWIAVHRWDCYVDGNNDMQGGLGMFKDDSLMAIMYNGNPHGNPFRTPLITDFIPNHDQWYHIEVFQRLHPSDGSARNQVWVDGVSRGSSTTGNYNVGNQYSGSGAVINRLRIGTFGSAQSDPIYLYFANQTISTHQIGSSGGGTEPAPSQVQNLRMTGRTQTSIAIAWDAVSHSTLSGYDVQGRLSGSSSWTTITTTGSSTTSYNVQSLSQNTTYEFRVRAKSGSGDGSWSSILSASTLESADEEEPPPLVPNFRSTEQTQNSISLAWDSVTHPDLEDYQVQRKLTSETGDENFQTIFFGEPLSTRSFTDSNLLGDTSYDYRIRARAMTDGVWNEGEYTTITVSTIGSTSTTTVEAITASSGDYHIVNSSATYSSARAGTGAFNQGTYYAGNVDWYQSAWHAYQGFFHFNTTNIEGTVTSAILRVTVEDNQGTVADTWRVRVNNTWAYNLSTTHFVPGADLSSFTLVGTQDIGAGVEGVRDIALDVSAINVGGATRLMLHSQLQESSTAPSQNDRWASITRAGTTGSPQLVIQTGLEVAVESIESSPLGIQVQFGDANLNEVTEGWTAGSNLATKTLIAPSVESLEASLGLVIVFGGPQLKDITEEWTPGTNLHVVERLPGTPEDVQSTSAELNLSIFFGSAGLVAVSEQNFEPPNLVVIQASNFISLSWDPVANVSSYVVHARTPSTGQPFDPTNTDTQIGVTLDTEFSYPNPGRGSYDYQVFGVIDSGATSLSYEVEIEESV